MYIHCTQHVDRNEDFNRKWNEMFYCSVNQVLKFEMNTSAGCNMCDKT